MSVMQKLHDSEINAAISSFYDGCWTVQLGDQMNGFKSAAVVGSLTEAEAWLDRTARQEYPNSAYARAAHDASEEGC